MPASALDKVVKFAGDYLFDRITPTLTKLEATPGDRIDFRISCQPDRDAKSFLISSLMKQVLKSSNKSTNINDLIKTHSQMNAEKVDSTLYRIEIQKIMLCKTVTWNDMKL